jgi:transcriptional regulator with GAF, ATPase, and Fis domain
MEQTLTELEAVQGRYTIESWAAYKERAAKGMDYRYRGTTIEAVTNRRPEAQEAFKQGRSILIKVPASFEAGKTDETVALAVPMRLRGQVIGVLNFQFESATISSDIIVTLEEVASRLALVLENARLLSDAQRLALQEQQINIISTQVRRSASLDAILQNTVRELGKAMGASRTFIQFGIEPLKASSSQPNEDPNGHS